MNPAIFDTLGIIAFTFLATMSLWFLYTKKQPKKWFWIILLIIGIAGLVIDILMVQTNLIG